MGNNVLPELISLPAPKPRDLYFQKQVDQATIGELTKSLLEINKHDQYLEKVYALYGLSYVKAPVRLYIDSYGGSVYQGLGIIGVMQNSTTPIYTYVTGVAMSCGFLMAIHGHKRFAYEHATFMYHQLSSAAWGTMADMEQTVKEFKRLHNILLSLTVKATKIPLSVLKENFDKKLDWYMDVDTALKLGCVDAIVGED